jgi:hypothetical protein
MSEANQRLAELGVSVPELVLPAPGTDLARWAVVACDQYSSERAHWDGIAAFVGAAPSTLNLIFPECYLEDPDKAERVSRIQRTMKSYIDRGVVRAVGRGFVLVERRTPYSAHPRKGLVIAVDLEAYRYGKGVTTMIRPTEGTIVERLPPRMEIRRGAPLELPHIMLLIDDPKRTVIEPLYARMGSLTQLYDFELMQGAGRLRGALVSGHDDLERVASALEVLADRKAFAEQYGQTDVLLFAVGDGNHSLATAKAIWEETKAAGAGDPSIMEHPARYAMVELVNIYDEGLPFHPIHRVLFKVDEDALLADLDAAGAVFEPMPWNAAVGNTDGPADANGAAKGGTLGEHRFALVSGKRSGLLRVERPAAKLAAGTIQAVLDAHLAAHPGTVIDYIHGTESLESLARRPGNLGLYLPPIDKSSFFGTVIRDGVMPRKTFSMGEAPEKRFYVEARRIVR